MWDRIVEKRSCTDEKHQKSALSLGQVLSGVCATQDSTLTANTHSQGQGVGAVGQKVMPEVTQGQETLGL